MNNSQAVKVLSALGHESRLAIYKLLVKAGSSGLPAGTISEILKIPSATLSFHLTLMSNANLLDFERSGRVITYFARPKAIKKLNEFLEK